MSYDAESLSDCGSAASLSTPDTLPFAEVYHISFCLLPPDRGDFLSIQHVVGEVSGLQDLHCGQSHDFNVLLNKFH